ncbi:MAG: aldo/keto reductase [Hyphomicrobiales bacterium]|nr:aldo/keto reductase [Hyphomicrobiales bacterium]
MDYTTLGATGLRVGVAGFGCGGNSRIGLGAGLSRAESVALGREAVDLGVNFFDTAESYGTEEIVGDLAHEVGRDALVIATKSGLRRGQELLSAAEVVANLDASLRRLRTDVIDVYQLHAVRPGDYDRVMAELVPALLREKEAGKFRHLGITETAPRDPVHETLLRAVEDDCWEVMMLAFHMLNQNARPSLFPAIERRGVGTLLMFVVRNIFSQPGLLSATMADLAAEGRVPAELGASDDPLGFLVHEGGASSVIDAAYRFARHEPGADIVLFGTGSSAHLKSNVASILKPPLPAEDVERLYELFGALEGVGLDLPDRVRNAVQ